MNISDKLSHTADLYKRGATNDSGEITYSLDSNIACLSYGSKARVINDSQPQTSTRTTDFSIIIKSEQAIELGDQLKNGKDINGVSIFDGVEVVTIKDIIHRTKGILSKELGVNNIRG